MSHLSYSYAIAAAVVPFLCGCTTHQLSNEQALAWSVSPQQWKRLAAAEKLADSGGEEALARLREMASDSDAQVKGTALSSFGKWKDKQAIPILIAALTVDGTWKDCKKRAGRYVLLQRYLSETAHESLMEITGFSIDSDPCADLDQRKALQQEWERRVAQDTGVATEKAR